jgi:molybdate transport system regulatory protein
MLLKSLITEDGGLPMVKMSYKTRITLRAEGSYDGHGFGRGIELLLLGIEEYGSLNRAAKELGMAYSKAWRIIRQAETEFDLTLIYRDGAHGSTLSEEGRTFLAHYQEMLTAADQAAGEVFERYFMHI